MPKSDGTERETPKLFKKTETLNKEVKYGIRTRSVAKSTGNKSPQQNPTQQQSTSHELQDQAHDDQSSIKPEKYKGQAGTDNSLLRPRKSENHDNEDDNLPGQVMS